MVSTVGEPMIDIVPDGIYWLQLGIAPLAGKASTRPENSNWPCCGTLPEPPPPVNEADMVCVVITLLNV